MRFAPRPENDFADYIRTYYRECRYRFDRVEGIAGKWMFRDLLPGMSDFDSRLIVGDDMEVEDWCRMSTVIGDVHLMLCEKYPAWARNLEHLPGINLTWEELGSERNYYPEYHQWTYFDTARPEKLGAVLDRLVKRPWDEKDEYFHLKRFCQYYGRYNRTIDPAINLGAHTNKYPLHSRIMHYFNPPVLAAMCLLERRGLAGKMDGFELAAQRFPDLRCWDLVREILHAGYETPRWYKEPHLTELEDALEEGLAAIALGLRPALTLVPESAGADVAAWSTALQSVPVDPTLAIFDSAKFSRLMKGRLEFYARAPSRFDTTWLIQNELSRIGTGFFQVPFRTFWQIRTGEQVEDPVTILGELRGEVLDDAEIEATGEFARLTPGHWEEGRERDLAMEIVAVFDGFFRALTRISQAV